MRVPFTTIVMVLVIVVLTALLISADRKPLRRGDEDVLRYSAMWQWLARGLWLFPAGVALAAMISPPNPGEAWIVVALIVGSSALNAVIALEVFRREVVLDANGIRQRSAWSRPQAIAWTDVRKVSVNIASEVVLRASGDREIRVSMWLSGLDALAAALESRLAAMPTVPKVVRSIRAFRV